jgi:hypothetical protein
VAEKAPLFYRCTWPIQGPYHRLLTLRRTSGLSVRPGASLDVDIAGLMKYLRFPPDMYLGDVLSQKLIWFVGKKDISWSGNLKAQHFDNLDLNWTEIIKANTGLDID